MHRAEVFSFAWELADAAAPFLSTETFALVCVKIGAGELDSAIRYLLHCLGSCDAELSAERAVAVREWIRGYRGSEDEFVLRRLAGRIRVSATPEQPVHRVDARRYR
jgi:hypothetical protein